jgi:hypothetical protein
MWELRSRDSNFPNRKPHEKREMVLGLVRDSRTPDIVAAVLEDFRAFFAI